MARTIDLVKFCKEIMKRLSKNDIRIDDYRHVEMCDDYKQLVDNGHKKEYEMTVRAKVGDNEGDFAHLPASGDTHDYGNMIVASSREALLGVIDNIEQVADGELSRTEQNKATKAACVEIRKSLNPSYAKEQERDEAISNLNNRLDGIESTMSQVLKLLNKK